MFLSNDDTLRLYNNVTFDTTDLNSALFHPLDIEKFESDHPGLFPQAPLAQARKRIAELERQLKEIQQENESLTAGGCEVVPPPLDCKNCSSIQDAEQRIADLKASNRDLQSSLDAAQAGRARWVPSYKALFQAMNQVWESGRDDWTKDGFLGVAREIYKTSDAPEAPLDEAERLAWAALPDRFKAGPGNPKNKGNPTKE